MKIVCLPSKGEVGGVWELPGGWLVGQDNQLVKSASAGLFLFAFNCWSLGGESMPLTERIWLIPSASLDKFFS